MLAKISEAPIDDKYQNELSPRSPRNKICRKPQNLRNRFYQEKQKKLKSTTNQLIGFYSPKHQQEIQTPFDHYQLNTIRSPQLKTLRNQRSLTHLNKGNCSNSRPEHHQNKRKQNSVSNSSGKSENDRRISRLQLQLKALSYQNNRLKTENTTLAQENAALKNQLLKMQENNLNQARFSTKQNINKLPQTVQRLQNQIKSLKDQLFDLQILKQSKQNLESFIKALQTINQQQRQELFQQGKLNKYLQIQLRTLKKQRMITQTNKKLHNQFLSIEADNKKLRKLVFDLQNRIKSNTIFDLTPDVSQKNDSFLLDQNL